MNTAFVAKYAGKHNIPRRLFRNSAVHKAFRQHCRISVRFLAHLPGDAGKRWSSASATRKGCPGAAAGEGRVAQCYEHAAHKASIGRLLCSWTAFMVGQRLRASTADDKRKALGSYR